MAVKRGLENVVSNNLNDINLQLIVKEYSEILNTKLDKYSFIKYIDPIDMTPQTGSHKKKVKISACIQYIANP